MYIIEDRISEIRDRLGPVLNELGLEVDFIRAERHVTVSFLLKPGSTHFSPVEIKFVNGNLPNWQYLDFDDDFPEPDHVASWDDAHLLVHQFHCRALGDTGFEYWHQGDLKFRALPKVRSKNELFTWLQRVVETYGLIPTGGVTPNCIASHSFANAYKIVKQEFPDISVAQEILETGTLVETLSFVDSLGRSVSISMQVDDSHAFVSVDGEEIMSFEQTSVAPTKNVFGARWDHRMRAHPSCIPVGSGSSVFVVSRKDWSMSGNAISSRRRRMAVASAVP